MGNQFVKDIPYSVHMNGASQGKATAVPFAAATKLTCAGWVKFDVHKLVNVIETSPWFYTTNGFGLYRALNGQVGLSLRDVDNVRYDTMLTAAVPNNRWIRFLFTIDISLATLQGKLYLDGVDAVTSRVAESQLIAGIATNDLYFGTSSAGGIGALEGGLIVDYILTGKAATAAEAAADYFQNQRPSGGTLLAEYAWNEGTGTTITDTGTGAKNITFSGGSTWSTSSPMKLNNAVVKEQNLIKSSRLLTDPSWTTDGTATAANVTGLDWEGNTSTFSRITATGGSLQFVRGASYLPATRAGIYTIAARVKSVAGGTQKFSMSPSVIAAYSPDITVTGEWTQAIYTVTVPTNTSTVVIRGDAANEAYDIYMDDIQIVRANFAPAKAKTTTGTAYDIGDMNNKTITQQNHLLSSGAIEGTPWNSSVNITRADNTPDVLDPLGGSRMGKLTDTSDGGVTTHILLAGLATVKIGQNYTFSGIYQAGTISKIAIALLQGSIAAVWFDLTAGTVGTMQGFSAKILPVYLNGVLQVGKWECIATFTPSIISPYQFRVYMATTDGALTYTGNGAGTVYVYGPQINDGNEKTPYKETTSVAYNVGTPNNAARTSQNLFSFSNALESWNGTPGSITESGRSDPFGGTGAQTWTPSGLNSRIDHPAAYYTTKPGATYTCLYWARVASGIGSCTVQTRDDTMGPVGPIFTLTGTWKECVTTWTHDGMGNSVAICQDIGNTQTPIDIYNPRLVQANHGGIPTVPAALPFNEGNINNLA